ncbi:glycosyltransferase [Gottschalkia purinilytica]|uniref:Glycosyltransferase n=1 Tax=Gottschalkia purinilytica TaxID=1503 RepID=A0A0L0WCH1_GOTPU|nr:glycosyltransferase [Gottschalkia purinilytica]KNF09179.1 glycosyltransferase [Gottschalkia purinilytica]
MKVLHLISGGDTGGARTHIINLLKELQKNIDVKLICFMKGDFYEQLLNEGINIHVLEQKKRYDFSIIKRLVKEIKQEKYDIIHCHGARANFIGAIIKIFCKTPIVTTIHSDYILDFKGNFYKSVVYKNLNYIALKRMDYYIGVSNNFKEMMISRGFNKNKIFTVYNGIDTNIKMNIVDPKEFFNKYNISFKEESIKVGILARLHPVKGLDVFLKGAQKVIEKNNNVEFFIAGDGEEEENLKNMSQSLNISKNVHFLGFVKEQFSFLNAIDINTITSYSESFPYVILEGALLKKPIVSSNVGGIKDLVSDEYTGFLFEPGEYDDFAEKLNILINDNKLIHEQGENLYSKVCNQYSSESMSRNHVKIYDEILNS